MSRDITLGQIRPDPDQPRQLFREEKIEELAQSLKANGQAVPIAVRPEEGSSEGEGFVIIHGERRWRAAKRLGWETITADVQDVTAEIARWRSLTENVQREDLTPIEEARAYRRQLDRHDLTQTELGERIGKSQSYVAQKLRLLRLPSPLSFFLETGALSEGHARQLMTIEAAYLDGATRPVPFRPEKVDTLGAHDLRMSVNHLRPMDWPPFLPDLSEEPRRDMVRGALKRLCEAAGENRQIPAWIAAAWYYGLRGYCTDLSVSDLSDVVGAFTDRIESHLGFFFTNAPWHRAAPEVPRVALSEDEEGTPIKTLCRSALRCVERGNYYRGALADLRHAGLSKVLRATWRHKFPEKTEKRAPSINGSSETDLSEDELDANADRLLECSCANVREGRRLWPSKMNYPGTREHREANAACERIGQLKAMQA